MNQLTRQEVEAVIDRLADKTLSFGCQIIIEGIEAVITKAYNGTYFFSGRRLIEQGLRHYPLLERATIIGHPITIGQVLEKMKIEGNSFRLKSQSNEVTQQPLDRFIFLWDRCGVAKSLQEIMSYSGWERSFIPVLGSTFIGEPVTAPPALQVVEILKSPEANALFSFLIEIGL